MTTAGPGGEHYSRLVRDLCALISTLVSSSPSPAAAPGMSPAAAASMLLGASVALMLCGSVTFAIGLLLMPWVAGIVLLFGFAGAVSSLSSGFLGIGRPTAIPCKGAPTGRICSPVASNVLVP